MMRLNPTVTRDIDENGVDHPQQVLVGEKRYDQGDDGNEIIDPPPSGHGKYGRVLGLAHAVTLRHGP